MDSQITLINSNPEPESKFAAPDPAFGATTILDFDNDVMISTNATVRGQSQIRYSIRTVKAGLAGMNHKTVLSQGERVLATVQRRDVAPDSLVLGGQTMNLGSWLKTPMLSSFPASFSEGGETYVWKEGDEGIDLYRGGASTSTSIIARFYASEFVMAHNPDFVMIHNRRIIIYRAHLDLRPEADLIREKVFISCVLIVQKMRKNGNATRKGRDVVSAGERLMFSFMGPPAGG